MTFNCEIRSDPDLQITVSDISAGHEQPLYSSCKKPMSALVTIINLILFHILVYSTFHNCTFHFNLTNNHLRIFFFGKNFMQILLFFVQLFLSFLIDLNLNFNYLFFAIAKNIFFDNTILIKTFSCSSFCVIYYRFVASRIVIV